ncbi:hypothetical protein WJ972_12240 [Achromobacter insuavis]
MTLHRAGFEVTGVGHEYKGMFGSVCGARALLGDDALAPAGAAACTVIEPPRK